LAITILGMSGTSDGYPLPDWGPRRQRIAACLEVSIGFTLIYAATNPSGALHRCVAGAECTVDLHYIWLDFCLPLIAVTALVLVAVAAVYAGRWARIIILLLTVVALLHTLFVMMLALGHNPQEVYCVTIQEGLEYRRAIEQFRDPSCAILWHNWLPLGFIFWIFWPYGVAMPLGFALVYLLGRRLMRVSGGG
jgi:hypothetical protein